MLVHILCMDEKQISGLHCILILSLVICNKKKKKKKKIFATAEGLAILFHSEFNPNDITVAAINQLSITSCSIQYRQPTHKHHVYWYWDSKIWQPDDAAEAHDTAEELVLNVLWAILVAMTKLKSRINSFCNCHVKCSENIRNSTWQPVLLPRLVVMELMWWITWHEAKIIASLQCIKVGGIGDTTLSHVRRWTYVDKMPLCNSEMDVHNLWELDWILYGNMRNTYVCTLTSKQSNWQIFWSVYYDIVAMCCHTTPYHTLYVQDWIILCLYIVHVAECHNNGECT